MKSSNLPSRAQDLMSEDFAHYFRDWAQVDYYRELSNVGSGETGIQSTFLFYFRFLWQFFGPMEMTIIEERHCWGMDDPERFEKGNRLFATAVLTLSQRRKGRKLFFLPTNEKLSRKSQLLGVIYQPSLSRMPRWFVRKKDKKKETIHLVTGTGTYIQFFELRSDEMEVRPLEVGEDKIWELAGNERKINEIFTQLRDLLAADRQAWISKTGQ